MKPKLIKILALAMLVCQCAIAQQAIMTPQVMARRQPADLGYNTAMKLRPNVVQLLSKTRGFGLIVAVQKDIVYVVTSRELVAYGPPNKVGFFEGPSSSEIQELKLRGDDNGLALLKVKAPSTATASRILACTSQEVYPDTRVWVIGAKGEIVVSSGSKAGVIWEVNPTSFTFNTPLPPNGITGASIVNETGMIGIVTQADGDHITAIKMEALKATLLQSNYPFELSPTQQAVTGQKCAMQIAYRGFGITSQGNEVPLQLYVKRLRINNEEVSPTFFREFPFTLQFNSCDKAVYEIDAELTNGSQVWRGRGRGELPTKGDDVLFVNWKQTSPDLMELSLVH